MIFDIVHSISQLTFSKSQGPVTYSCSSGQSIGLRVSLTFTLTIFQMCLFGKLLNVGGGR